MKKRFAIIVIILAVAAAYAPALRDAFVWDDTALILRDPLIRSWRLIPEGFNHFLFVDATPSNFYRPLQRLTYTVEYALFTARPGPYHVTSVLIHAGAAIMLWLFAEALLEAFGCEKRRAQWIAWIAALIWAIHPVHTAAVVYVSGRADPLAALFGFIGCYLLLTRLVRPRSRSIVLLLGAGFAFLCSALSKETGLLFPLLMLLIFALLKQRTHFVKAAVVTLVVGALYLSLRLPAEHEPVPELGTPAPAAVRAITIARAVAEYAGLLILPLHLHMERDLQAGFSGNLYQNSSAAAARELQTLLGIAIAAAFIVWAARSTPRSTLPFALAGCAIRPYLPVSGVLPVRASVAEHCIYL